MIYFLKLYVISKYNEIFKNYVIISIQLFVINCFYYYFVLIKYQLLKYGLPTIIFLYVMYGIPEFPICRLVADVSTFLLLLYYVFISYFLLFCRILELYSSCLCFLGLGMLYSPLYLVCIGEYKKS